VAWRPSLGARSGVYDGARTWLTSRFFKQAWDREVRVRDQIWVIIYILNCIRDSVAAQRSNQDKVICFRSFGGSRTAALLIRRPGVIV